MRDKDTAKAKGTIMIVDDSAISIRQALTVLKNDYRVICVKSGNKTLEYLNNEKNDKPDLILLDINMPDMSGYELLKRIKQEEYLKNIPVIFLTAEWNNERELRGLELGAVDFIKKPFEANIILKRINTQIELYRYRNKLEDMLENEQNKMQKLSLQAILTIANTVDARDIYTKQHSSRVALYSKLIGKKLGWDNKRCDNIYNAALLHDIGKIGVPDAILNKPQRLTGEEYEIMKQHVKIGSNILKDITYVDKLKEVVQYHHERYDGQGYGNGLKGENIPIEARIVGIADAFDAMTSDRVYRGKRSMEYVKSEFKKGRGNQFDPQLVDIFMGIIHENEMCNKMGE